MISLGMVFFTGRQIYKSLKEKPQSQVVPSITPSPTASPSATPKPQPMTYDQMSKQYGPCVDLPVLMYHHVEPQELAIKNKRTGLNVEPEMFEKQMKYLVDKGYQVIQPQELNNFFDNNTPIPKKSVVITFDDGYVDNGDLALPILQKYNLRATIFLATGLMENFNYLTWAKINEMKNGGLIYFGNHTWSHTGMGKNYETDKKEISLAQTQLTDKGLDGSRIFAYPYGAESSVATKVLNEQGYTLAFTTHPGRIMCKGKRLNLPRVRIGNAPLSNFGL